MVQTSDVDAIVIDGRDSNGRAILDVYAKQSGRYAVYQTEGRVVICYADDPLVQRIQRKRLARISVLRSEIDGMLTRWRDAGDWSRLPLTARQYDMRVASALTEALEDEAETGISILEAVKADIAGEMASRARLGYVAWSIASALILLVVSLLVHAIVRANFGSEPLGGAKAGRYLLAAISTGTLGALYSTAMRIEKRDLRNDFRRLDQFTDAFVRIGLGALGAFVLGCFLLSGAIQLNFGSEIVIGRDAGGTFIFVVLIAGFLAGFVERLVPDLLNSYAIAARPPGSPPPLAAPPPPDTKAAKTAPNADLDDLPAHEDDVIATPGADEDVDGCEVDLADEASLTPDENLPPASGGVAAQQ